MCATSAGRLPAACCRNTRAEPGDAAMTLMTRFLAIACLVLTAAMARPSAVLAAPNIEKVHTASGIEVWLVREPSIPMLALQAAWRGGSASDPAGEEGLASLAMALLTEGAGDLKSDDFQNAKIG